MNEYEQLLQAAEAALGRGEVEKAEELMASANAVKAKLDAQAKLAGMKADAAARAAEKAKEAEAKRKVDEDARIMAEVAKRVRAALKEHLQRPDFQGEDEIPTVQMRGPFDAVDANHLALGYMVMKAAQAMGKPGPSLDYRRAVHGRAAKAVEGGLAVKGVHDDSSPVVEYLDAIKARRLAQPVYYHQKADNQVLKALSVKADELMGSDVSTAGDEWVPVFYSRELFRLIRNEAMVASLFRQMEVAGESIVFPLQTGGATWYKTAQTDDAAELVYSAAFLTSRVSQVATSNMTLTPSKLSAIILWTGELNEQSLVPMLPFLQEELVTSGAHTLDELIISGDETTGATNISDYANGSISAYWRLLVFNGLRHTAIVDTSANSRDGGALTSEDFIETKKLMGTNGRNAVRPGDVVWLMDHQLYYKMLTLGEVLTEDKFGAMATIKDGMIQRIFGSPVVTSDDYGATDSSGYIHNTVAGNTKGSFMCVRPDQAVIGFGRRMVIETARIARSDAYEIVGHMSVDMDLATDEAVGLSYNITV